MVGKGLTVQSLQFKDIVGQLLTHADRELGEQEHMMTDVFNRLGQFVEAVQSGGNLQTALLELNSSL